MKMLNIVAETLALAALDNGVRSDLSEADTAIVTRFNSDPDDLDFVLEYFNSVITYDDRRFIMGDDGDVYIVEGSTVYYLPVESALGGEFEICAETL
jgi:hypothetical protein